MSPSPYCVLCNREHVPGECPDRAIALLGWFLLLVASVIAGLAFGALSVGVI